jgi:membrane-associated phospholipid phosphatase
VIKQNSLATAVKFLLFLTFVLAVNVGELSPDTRPCFHIPCGNMAGTSRFPAPAPGSKLNFQYQYSLARLHLQDTGARGEQLDLNSEYWEGFYRDIKWTFNAPFHWKGPDWLRVAAVTGITLGLIANDRGIMSRVQEHRSKTTNRISKIAENFGDPTKVLPGLVLLYSYASLFKDKKAKHIALLSFKTCAASLLTVYGLKLLFHRCRPSADNPNKWGGPGFSFKREELSFPSGHSAIAFSIATVIASEYKGTVIPVIAYSTAVLTALSRVHDKRHWSSDVFFGSVIGYFIARGILSRNKNHEASAKRIRVFPLIAFHGPGLSMSIEF